MTTLTITPQLKVTMLKLLVAGRDLDFVAAATHAPRDTVLDIVSKHGYPEIAQMSWAVDALVNAGDRLPVRSVASHRDAKPLDEPATTHAQRVTLPTPRPNGFAVVPPATHAHVPPATADLLLLAEQSPFIRTQNIGKKIAGLFTDLGARLADETAARDAKVKADRDAAAVATRIAQLQAEINKLKRKPAKTTTPRSESRRYTINPGDHACPVPSCDRTFDTSQGVALHQRRAHTNAA